MREVFLPAFLLATALCVMAGIVYLVALTPDVTRVRSDDHVAYFQCWRGLIDNGDLWITENRMSSGFDYERDYVFDTGMSDGALARWRGDTLDVITERPSIPPAPRLPFPVEIREVGGDEYEMLRHAVDDGGWTAIDC